MFLLSDVLLLSSDGLFFWCYSVFERGERNAKYLIIAGPQQQDQPCKFACLTLIDWLSAEVTPLDGCPSVGVFPLAVALTKSIGSVTIASSGGV